METLPALAKRAAPSMAPLGGALLAGGILLLAASILVSAFHASMLMDPGYWNLEPSVQATCWTCLASAVPALVVMLAGAGWCTRSMAPRSMSVVALVALTLWSAAAVSVLALLFPLQGLALGCLSAVAAFWAALAALIVAALVRSRPKA